MIADRYVLGEQIGTGGMATVWRATDTLLNRSVAVKRLLPHLAMDAQAAGRFKREAQAAAGLSHPGIMNVYDTGEDEDGPFIVLELIEGQTVADLLAEAGAFNPADTVDIVSQLGRALDHAHAQGIVHRDIKPANLFIDPSGRVRLTDFGIAKTVDDPTTVTAAGELVGTIAYMAPELLEGQPASSLSDVYSLAAVTYELLAGRPPFSAATPAALLEAVRGSEPANLPHAVPGEMRVAVAAGMSKDPGRRPQTAGGFAFGLTGATVVLGPDEPPQPTRPLAPTITLVASDEQTKVTSPRTPILVEPTQTSTSTSTSGRRSVWPLLVAILFGVIALAAAALSADWDPADTDPPLAGQLAAGTTTTVPRATTVPTTPSTVATTTIVFDSPESVALGITALLADLQPPQFKPKDVRRVGDRLDALMEDWAGGKREDLVGQFEKSFDAVADLNESAQRDQLTGWFIQLAQLMGIDVDQESGDG